MSKEKEGRNYEIYNDHLRLMSIKDIAEKYGITRQRVYQVIKLMDQKVKELKVLNN